MIYFYRGLLIDESNLPSEIVIKTGNPDDPENGTFYPPYNSNTLERAGYISTENKPADTNFISYIWDGYNWEPTDSEAAKLRDEMWKNFRKTRNDLLTEYDSLVQNYIHNNQNIPQEWIDYRQQLRDLPQVYETGDINDWKLLDWPSSPHQQQYDENGGTGE